MSPDPIMYLIIQLCQAGNAPIDPVLLHHCRLQRDIHDEVAGMPRGSQHTLPLTCFINRAEVAWRRFEVCYKSWFKPYYRDGIE